MTKITRIGQIVPSSNTTMETEIPAIFRARETAYPQDGSFTFHSSRMRMKKEGRPMPIITSAGALIDELSAAGVRRISVVTPYVQPLTDLVGDYIRQEGIDVKASIALSIDDNVAAGARDPLALLGDLEALDTKGVDAVVLSACVQMPSLAAIARAEDKLGLPVTSAAICTARKMMRAIEIEPIVPGMGHFLSDRNLKPKSLAKSAAAAE